MGRARTLGPRVVDWVLLVAVGPLIAFPFAAELSIRHVPGNATVVGTPHTPEPLPPGTVVETAIPPLPLVSPGGFLERTFPDGVGLDDRAVVSNAVDALAGEIGLAPALADIDADLTESFGQPRYDDIYPYAYEPFDSVLAGALDADTVRTRPGDVVDLSSLLYMEAVLQEDGLLSDRVAWSGALAYSLLNTARTHVESCAIQTNLLFVMGTGLRPRHDDLAAELEEAERLCGPDDPTPAWIRAKSLAATFGLDEDPRLLSAPLADLMRMAEEAFEALEQRFPDLPHGHAGHADLLLGWADQVESIAVAPFQARQWRSQAATLYAEARALSADPRLLVGHARALSHRERHEEAVATAELAVDLRPEDFTARVVLTDVLSRAGDHRAAADAIEQEASSVLPWWQDFDSLFRVDALAGSYGMDEFPPTLVLDASNEDFGGAVADDLGFFPTSRYPAPIRGCRGALLLTERLLAREPAETLRLLDDGVSGLDVFDGHTCASGGANPQVLDDDSLRAVAELANGGTGDEQDYEHWQDMLRADGQLEEARRVAQAWTAAHPESGRAWQRLGEIAFLDGDLDAAVTPLETAAGHFAAAAEGWFEEYPDAMVLNPPHELAWAHLQLGGLHAALGNSDEARDDLYAALAAIEGQDPNGYWHRYLTTHARGQLGGVAMGEEDWTEAVDHYRASVRAGKPADGRALYAPTRGEGPEETPSWGGLLKGAQENNLALALAMAGEHIPSIRAAEGALRRDPASPVFLDTLAFALQKAGRPVRAAEVYDRALELDATSYVSANNRAVILARGGRDEAAEELLEAAIAMAPDYATAWHNLGVVKSRSWSLTALLQSQGALGRAAELDPDLRGTDKLLVMDDEIADAHIDVSRPIPPDWTYAASAEVRTPHLTVTLLILLLLRIAWALGLERLGSFVSERVIRAGSDSSRFGWWRRALPAPWALAVTVVVLVGTLSSWVANLTSLLLLVAVVGIVGLPVVARRALAAREGVTLRHYSWPPAMAVGALATPLGLSFAPFPSLDTGGATLRSRLRWAGPVAIAAAGAALVTAALLTGVPLARSASAAALLLLGSMFVPVPPLDGSHLRNRAANVAITVGLGLATAAFAARWV